jgi:hypothetical protein
MPGYSSVADETANRTNDLHGLLAPSISAHSQQHWSMCPKFFAPRSQEHIMMCKAVELVKLATRELEIGQGIGMPRGSPTTHHPINGPREQVINSKTGILQNSQWKFDSLSNDYLTRQTG